MHQAIPIYDRKRRPGEIGRKVCPRRGRVLMHDKFGRRSAIDTSCKAWGCYVCGPRKVFTWSKKLYSVMAEFESLKLITFTLKKEGNYLRDAAYVRAALAQFLKLYRQRHGTIEGLTVPELTKNKVPHLHGIFTTVPNDGLVRCQRMIWNKYTKKWLNGPCQCLHHVVCRLWYEVTGDSYVVDVRPIIGDAKGVSLYLAKYLMKGALGEQRQLLESIGFSRRWSRTRGFPWPEVRLRGSVEDSMVSFEFISTRILNDELENIVAASKGLSDLDLVSSESFMAISDQAAKKRKIKRIERLLGGQ